MARGLSGSGQYLSRADQTALRIAFPIAVSMWFKGGAQGNFKYLLSKMLLAGEHASYAFASDPGGDLRFYIGLGTNPGDQNNSPAVAAATVFNNAWHHLLGTYDGSNIRLYVDGTEAGSGTPETLALAYNTNSLYIGSFDGTQLYATGSAAEVALFNAIPNADERGALADGFTPIAVKPSAVVAYWPLIGRYSPEIDVRQGMNLTVTSATTADHCRVFQRTRSLWIPPPTAGAATVNGDVSFTATATVTTTANVDRASTASPTTTATITPTAAVDRAASSAPTTTATITATAAVDRAALASVTATATISPTAAVDRPAQTTVTTTATITATAAVARAAAASVTATATIAPVADLAGQVNASASHTATATVSPAAAVDRAGAATLTTVATLTATAAVDRAAQASLTALATLSAAAARDVSIAAGRTVTVAVSPTGAVTLAAAASLTALATITAESADDVVNATSTATVGARRSSTVTATARLASSAAVGARLTSRSDVSDG